MNIKEFIQKETIKLIKESAEGSTIAQQLIHSFNENGIRFIDYNVDYDNNLLSIIISAKNVESLHGVELEMEFSITDEGYYNAGDGYNIPPEGDPLKWEMELINAKILSAHDADFENETESFLEFFNDKYDTLHDYFDEKIIETFDRKINESKEKSPIINFIKQEVLTIHKETLNEGISVGGLQTASGNPLDGKSRQSAVNYIYKIFKQIDHGQRYKDEAWENVHKIFDIFGQYGMDTSGGYDAEYNPGGINADVNTSQWKKWYYDFNYINNIGKQKTLTFVLTAHAAGPIEDPWVSYDITFYPVN